MSQDSVELIEEIFKSSSPKKSTKKQNVNYGNIPSTSTSTPVKSYGEGSSSQPNPTISLSQNILKRPNKYFASPPKSPSKKASPILSKYSPFRKNSPKFKHMPISSYFQRTPEKASENSLSQVFQSVKKTDEELFESLLDDDFDLSQVVVDDELLSPPSQRGKSSDITENSTHTRTGTEPTTLKQCISKDEQEETLSNQVDNFAEENDDNIFKAKRIKRKVKKALFPSSKSNLKSKSLLSLSTANCSSMADSHFEDTTDVSEIESSQTSDSKSDKLLAYDSKDSKESSSQNKENLQELEINSEIKSFNHSVLLNHVSNLRTDNSLPGPMLRNSLSEQDEIVSKYFEKKNSDLSEASCSQTQTGTSNRLFKDQSVVKSPTKSNTNSQNGVEDSLPPSQSSPSYAFADSYSTCVEAALTDCLNYLKENKERGIFVDLEELEKFVNGSLHQTRRRLYARLLINRKFKWYRVEDLKSYESTLNLTREDLVRELNHLEEEGFLTSNLDEVDLRTLLNLLQVKDLKQLCKFIRIGDNKPKPELIEQLVNFQEKQSVIQFFSQSSHVKKDSIVMRRTKDILGHCIKLREGPRNAFFQCLVFATYPYFSGDPSVRLNDYMNRLIRVQKNEISFPPFTVCKTVVFSFGRLFTMYQEALDIYENVFNSVAVKDWVKLTEYAHFSFNKLKEILEDDEVCTYVQKLPIFLHRFTAGHVYAKALFKCITENKKNSDKDFVVKGFSLLLDQNMYLDHKRGSFYEELAGTYQNHLKNNTKALKTILDGLKDPQINDLMKQVLSARGIMLNKRKTNPVSASLKEEVEKHLVRISEPICVAIPARCLQGKPGFKQVYISEKEDGLEYSSVEEMVKSHYRELGFTQIIHDEGATLRSLIFACVWDIIYKQPSGLKDHSVFHSPFQERPLDWYDKDFFFNRQTEILVSLLSKF